MKIGCPINIFLAYYRIWIYLLHWRYFFIIAEAWIRTGILLLISWLIREQRGSGLKVGTSRWNRNVWTPYVRSTSLMTKRQDAHRAHWFIYVTLFDQQKTGSQKSHFGAHSTPVIAHQDMHNQPSWTNATLLGGKSFSLRSEAIRSRQRKMWENALAEGEP